MTDREAEARTPTSPAALGPAAARLLRRAQREAQAGDAAAAVRSMASALALAPDDAEVLRWAGIAAQNVGDHAAAENCFRRALVVLPDDADLHVGLGVALCRLGQDGEGLAELQRACALAPESVTAWYNLAESLRMRAQTAAAIDALQRVLAIEPSHVLARLGLARAMAGIGRIDEAAAGLRAILRRDPGHVEAWLALADLKTVALDGDDLRGLGLALAQPHLASQARTRLQFVLAKALEDQGSYARAFEVLARANAEHRRHIKWNGAGEHARVDAILRVFAEPVARAPGAGLGREVIIIASPPRSGSTLVEQILASHPEVEGANEIKDLGFVVDAETRRRNGAFPLWVSAATARDWQRLGEEYLAATARWRKLKPRFTDKNLQNWVLAGTALAMLPAARVVIVHRDPLETCLACYRQWFDHGAEFSYDLDEMATFCIDFWRLSRFWVDKYPERVFDLEYETLLADADTTIRRLLEFCGLPFDPACLEFHRTERTVLSAPSAAQVRQPLRRDTARAARYGHALDGLRQRLRDAGLPVHD